MTRRNYRSPGHYVSLSQNLRSFKLNDHGELLASTEVKLLAQLAPRSMRSTSSHDDRQVMWLPASVYQRNFLLKPAAITEFISKLSSFELISRRSENLLQFFAAASSFEQTSSLFESRKVLGDFPAFHKNFATAVTRNEKAIRAAVHHERNSCEALSSCGNPKTALSSLN